MGSLRPMKPGLAKPSGAAPGQGGDKPQAIGAFRNSFRSQTQLPKPVQPQAPLQPKQPGLLKPKTPPTATPPKPPSTVAKSDELPSKKRIAHQKRIQAATSITGGTLGLTALAARGRSSQLNRALKLKRVPTKDIKSTKAKSQKLTDLSTYLTTAGAGIGGLGAYNFASYTNAEGKREIKKNQETEMDAPFQPYGEPDPFEVSKRVPFKGPLRLQRASMARKANKQRAAMATYQTNLHTTARRESAERAQARAMGTYKQNTAWSRNNADKLPSSQKPPGLLESKAPKLYSAVQRNPTAFAAGGAGVGGGAVGLFGGSHYKRRNS